MKIKKYIKLEFNQLTINIKLTFFIIFELYNTSVDVGFNLTLKKLFFMKKIQKKKEYKKNGIIKKISLKYNNNNLKLKN